MTLIEMMVVLFIIALLTVPVLSMLQDEARPIREAVRAVNVYLGVARNRALQTGRPVGVIFQRFPNQPDASIVLQQCEVPPPYAGDTTDAVVRVQDWTFRPDTWTDPGDGKIYPWPYWDNTIHTGYPPPVLVTLVLKVQVRLNDFSNNLIRPGDLMQLGGKGPYYTVVRDDGTRRTQPEDSNMPPPDYPPDFYLDENGYIKFLPDIVPPAPAYPAVDDNNGDGWIDNYVLTLALDARMLPGLPWPRFTDGFLSWPLTFKILRQPVKSAVQPLQLPTGTAVDLAFSGSDALYFRQGPNPTLPIVLMFASNGSVEGVYCDTSSGYGPVAATHPVYLLVGQLSRVNSELGRTALPDAPSEDEKPNWADLNSIWIAIQPQTGHVGAKEMYPLDHNAVYWEGTNSAWPFVPTAVNPPDKPLSWHDAIYQSRTFAREAQSLGGR